MARVIRLAINLNSVQSWLGLAFLISIGICFVAIASLIVDSILKIYRKRLIQGFVIDKLNNLTEYEKQILRYYFAKGTRSNTLKVDDGVVQELVACRIIYRFAQFWNMMEGSLTILTILHGTISTQIHLFFRVLPIPIEQIREILSVNYKRG